MAGNTPESLQVVPTGAALGAEVRDVDLSKPLSKDAFAEIAEAWADDAIAAAQ